MPEHTDLSVGKSHAFCFQQHFHIPGSGFHCSFHLHDMKQLVDEEDVHPGKCRNTFRHSPQAKHAGNGIDSVICAFDNIFLQFFHGVIIKFTMM